MIKHGDTRQFSREGYDGKRTTHEKYDARFVCFPDLVNGVWVKPELFDMVTLVLQRMTDFNDKYGRRLYVGNPPRGILARLTVLEERGDLNSLVEAAGILAFCIVKDSRAESGTGRLYIVADVERFIRIMDRLDAIRAEA